MSIQAICQENVDTIAPHETVQTAAHRMASRSVGSLVVVDENEHPIGMLTDRDLAVRVIATGDSPFSTSVADVMTGEVKTISKDASIRETLAVMRDNAVRRLPLVDASGKLVGIVSIEDIVALLSSTMAEIGDFLKRTAPSRLATS